MLNKQTRSAILRLSAEGHSLRRIAVLLSVARRSASAIARSGTDELPTLNRPSKAEAHRETIVRLLSDCDNNLSKVHRALSGSGTALPYSTLAAFCRRHNLVDTGSNPTRSISRARQWLSEILNGVLSVSDLQSQLGDASDLSILLSHLKHSRARHRKKASAILASKRNIPLSIIAVALYSSRSTIRHYIRVYVTSGAERLFAWNTTRLPVAAADAIKKTRVLELLHNKPSFYGINRMNWTQPALFRAYAQSYGEALARSALTRLLRAAGYRWKKARRVLTSPDPFYHEKVELLVKTLQSLTSDELFFFLDEWGPVQVKKRAGRAYLQPDASADIPRRQVPRGTVSLVGALSATANRVTWHFVTSKDSESMFDVLEVLYNQHHGIARIYVTWDAVSWHNSASLVEALDLFNEETTRFADGPIFEVVPLPTSAQFLNVIEGVLSGMTRAVVDNSDYQCPADMKRAISRHFSERNEHFRHNPRRAGSKIWDLDFFQDPDSIRGGDYLATRSGT